LSLINSVGRMSSKLDQIEADIGVTKAELAAAKSKLVEAEKSGDQAKIEKYENEVKELRALLIEQQRKENLLLAGAGTTISNMLIFSFHCSIAFILFDFCFCSRSSTAGAPDLAATGTVLFCGFFPFSDEMF
jgi:hypothetical protein